MTGTDLMPNGAVPDTFTGSNGAAWNSTNWTIALNQGTGGGATIQGNQGRIATGTVTGNRTSVRLLTSALLNSEIVFDWVVPVLNDQFPAVWARTPTAVDTASGYAFTLASGDMTLSYTETTSTYSGHDLVTYTHGFTAGTTVRTRIAVFGGTGTKTLKARTWLASGSEPTSSWQINTTDTHTVNTAGYWGFTTNSGSTGSKNFFIDNVDLHDTETPSQATLAAAGGITPSATLVKVAGKKFTGATTPTGALVALRVVTRAFAGAITPAGALKKVVPKAFAGTITPAATLLKQARKNFAGAATPGANMIRSGIRKMSGAIAPAGALVAVNVGRVFGRPGLVAMQLLQRATVTVRHRRD